MPTLIDPWTQVSPTQWERASTGYQRFFFRLALKARSDGRPEDYFILSTIRISPVPTVEQVASVWLSMRSLQPALAMDWKHDAEGFKLIYRSGNEDEWVKQTLVLLKGSATSAYSKLPFQSIATLLFFPETGELILRAPHWMTDGRGNLLFWNLFLEQLSEPTAPDGKEVERLPASVGDSVGAVSPNDLTEEQKKQTMDRFMGYASGGVSAIHPPTTIGTDAPGASTFQDALLGEHQTTSLVQGCKVRGFSVTSAVHAAIVLANIELSENKRGGDLSRGIVVFDFRKHLLPGQADKYLVNLYAIPYPFALPLASPTPATNFEHVAQWFGKYYRETFKSEDERRLVNHWLDIADAGIASPEAAAAPPQKDPQTSSIGIIDDYIKAKYGAWKVKDFHLMAEATSTPSCIFWYTFRGSLRLVYAYNEALYKKEDIRRMLETITGLLAKEFCDTS